MKKLITVIVLLSGIILSAETNKRNDAVEYYKNIYKSQKKSILMSQKNSDNINPDYSVDKKYTTINLCWKDTKEEDLKYLISFPEVESVTLAEAIYIKDIDLKYFSDLINLQYLDFSETRITGEGFKYLKNLPSLKEINLSHTRVTDRNLQELKKFKTLESIWLYKSKVTQKGVNMLQKELPDCFISLKPQD